MDIFNFNMNNIKKFYRQENRKYNSNIFEVVAGYDFVNKVYISKPYGDKSGVYNIIQFSKNKDNKFYTFNEAIEYIDSLIRNETDKMDIIKLIEFVQPDKKNLQNHYNECLHIFNALRETTKQIDFLSLYLQEAQKQNKKREVILYTHEIAKTYKAIKRLKKRYFYYFGNKSEEIQDLVLKYNYVKDIPSSLHCIRHTIKKLEEQKQLLIKEYNNFE